MHKFLVNIVFGLMLTLGLGISSVSWSAIVAPDDPIMPCDKVRPNNKPCSTDPGIVKTPEPVPTEKNTIVVPPEIPAEKLPNREKLPGSDTHKSNTTPSLH